MLFVNRSVRKMVFFILEPVPRSTYILGEYIHWNECGFFSNVVWEYAGCEIFLSRHLLRQFLDEDQVHTQEFYIHGIYTMSRYTLIYEVGWRPLSRAHFRHTTKKSPMLNSDDNSPDLKTASRFWFWRKGWTPWLQSMSFRVLTKIHLQKYQVGLYLLLSILVVTSRLAESALRLLPVQWALRACLVICHGFG